MALQGDIKDFSVVDILQLLYQQQKSGILSITEKDNEVEVIFDRGMIVTASIKKRSADDSLGEILIKANLISRKQLDVALEAQKETLKKLGDILIESGFISIIDLRRFLKLQTHETIFKLLSWKRGDYNFNQRLVTYDKKAIEPINTEHFLMDSLRMIDELPDLKSRVYSYNLVFERMPGAHEEMLTLKIQDDQHDSSEDSSFFVDEKEEVDEGAITREEKKIFDLVDGARTVKDIINLGRLGEFETIKALVSLMNKKLVDISFEMEEVKVKKPTVSFQDLFFRAIFLGIFVVMVIFLLFSYPRIISNFTISESKRAAFDYTQTMTTMEQVSYALSTFYLINGRYPDDLTELSESKFADGLCPGWEELFDYTPSSHSYTLSIR